MNENAFSYTYSAPCNQEVLNIRKKYLPREESSLDSLRALDHRVKHPAAVFASVYGALCALIMGAGMSLVMTDIGEIFGLANAMLPGIAIGVAGLGLALTTYPIYKGILRSRKKKYGQQILELSQQILDKKQ